ncbi:MAG: GNAT family acetyltransferase [Gluconacetobacter diazotrophicus]|nr:GNAT family acetyltransferase [Gluconacetobacter diazotrophicus]
MPVPPIRLAAPADETAAVALWHDCGLVVPWNDPAADFRFALAGPASAILLAHAPDDPARLLGSVMVGHDGHRGWLYYLATDPDRRRAGIGRALVRAAEAWLRDRGVPKLQLMIRDTNPDVVAFYGRLGFVLTPRIVMARRLDGSDAENPFRPG